MKATINDFNVQIHMPDAPSGEGVHKLPPYCPIPAYNTANYKCPDNWMNGSGKASSYFVQVQTGKHLWIDLNGLNDHTHHVAVVMSVQGINPVTNKPCSKLKMEQYRDKCPIHDINFTDGRDCLKCDHKWPAQNYMTTMTMPKGAFWIDGWHLGEGKISGFLITEEAMRGIAAQIIGKKRVYAIGIAFFVSKNPKPLPPPVPKPETIIKHHYHQPYYDMFVDKLKFHDYSNLPFNSSLPTHKVQPDDSVTFKAGGNRAHSVNMMSNAGGGMLRSRKISLAAMPTLLRDTPSILDPNSYVPESARIKAEIAGGATISQNLDYIDHSELDFYKQSPAGMIYLNYCLPAEFDEIINQPKASKVKNALSKLRVGN